MMLARLESRSSRLKKRPTHTAVTTRIPKQAGDRDYTSLGDQDLGDTSLASLRRRPTYGVPNQEAAYKLSKRLELHELKLSACTLSYKLVKGHCWKKLADVCQEMVLGGFASDESSGRAAAT